MVNSSASLVDLTRFFHSFSPYVFNCWSLKQQRDSLIYFNPIYCMTYLLLTGIIFSASSGLNMLVSSTQNNKKITIQKYRHLMMKSNRRQTKRTMRKREKYVTDRTEVLTIVEISFTRTYQYCVELNV